MSKDRVVWIVVADAAETHTNNAGTKTPIKSSFFCVETRMLFTVRPPFE